MQKKKISLDLPFNLGTTLDANGTTLEDNETVDNIMMMDDVDKDCGKLLWYSVWLGVHSYIMQKKNPVTVIYMHM